MDVLILIGIVILFSIVPVMIAAKLLNASNTGFVHCLIAVVLSSVAGGFVPRYISGEALALLVTFALSAVIYSAVLGARFVQSACIALLASVIQYGSIILLGILGLSLAGL